MENQEMNWDDLTDGQRELAGYLAGINEDQLAALRDLLTATIKRNAVERDAFNFNSDGLRFNVNMN
ncbi:MAG TPA: hypothetical protein PKK37_04470 [Candidatus Pacearchaeota archaeon]|nr:hypothetical protein [Candidatus Pacearchaeota archaeon]